MGKRMAGKKKTAKRIKKEDYWVRLQKAAAEYKNVLFFDADNVSSLQVLKIRARLRAIGAVMIMGKNVSKGRAFPTPVLCCFGIALPFPLCSSIFKFNRVSSSKSTVFVLFPM